MSARSRLWVAVFCLLVSYSTPHCFADFPEDAIVRITAKLNNNLTSVGTGSLISSDGKVLTCYHVIKDSRVIEIAHKSQHSPYTSVKILSISPDHDLAVLQIQSFPRGQRFLESTNMLPSAFSDQITAWGYPANYSYSLRRLEIDGFDKQWTKANLLRARTGGGDKSIFTNIDLDLITLRADIESGCSGGPILSNGKIVGIIEGSWTVDAVVDAWAIPMKYLTSGDQETNVLATNVRSWPPLKLTNEGSALGRSEVGLTIPLIIAVGQYGTSMNGLKEQCSPLAVQTPKAEAYLQQQLARAKDAESTRSPNFVVSSDKSLQTSLKSVEMMQMVNQIRPCITAWFAADEDGKQLTMAVEEYLGDASHVEHDRKVFTETKERVRNVSKLLNRQETADYNFIYPVDFKETWTLADYQEAFRGDLSILHDDHTNPAKMYQELLVELDNYNDTVNKLISLHQKKIRAKL
jgi:hypothetical protein